MPRKLFLYQLCTSPPLLIYYMHFKTTQEQKLKKKGDNI